MTTDLTAVLQDLTARPSTENPLLSVYLDWSVDGNGQRPALRVLQQEFDQIADRIAAEDRPAACRDSFAADRQRIMDFLDQEVPDYTAGIAIFACHAEGLWQPITLQVPVETRVIEARYPHVFTLARIIDDYETYAVVLADSQESRIIVVALNNPQQAATTEAAEEIRRFQAGGWAQMIFQRRTDNVIKAHTKEIAEELARIIRRHDVQHVIIAGNDSLKGIILNTLPDQIKNLLVDYIHLDINGNLQSIMEVVDPMMREVERQQEAEVVQRLQDQAGGQGMGIVGVAPVALALTKGQVMVLIMHQNFMAAGGECPNCGTLRAGNRVKCPYDGADMQPVDLREIFTARAIQQSAEVQIVEASEYLDQHEGVGAMLRYRDDQEQARTA